MLKRSRREALADALIEAREAGARDGSADAVELASRRHTAVRATALPTRATAFARAVEEMFTDRDLTTREDF